MKDKISIEIKNLKNFKHLKVELPLTKGIYAITGPNGIGKSTFLSALSKFVYPSALNAYLGDTKLYQGAEILYEYNGQTWHWEKQEAWKQKVVNNKTLRISGTFESSLIFGNRFSDAHKSSIAKTYRMIEEDVIDASDFVKRKLGFILKNNEQAYLTLKKLPSIEKAKELGFTSIQYLYAFKEQNIVHQLRMSSGEFLLIGLLDYLNEKCIEKKDNNEDIQLVIIDEIELALHPEAQSRLLNTLNELSSTYNLVIYFSTHSPTIISEISPSNIYYLQSYLEQVTFINPCYPSYAIKNLHQKNGCDFLFLVEDELASSLIEKSIKKIKGRNSRVINILPCGDWRHTLKNHRNFVDWKIFPRHTKIFSILDGDVKEECENYINQEKNSVFKNLNKQFLPIESLEKYLYQKIIDEQNINLIKDLGDNFFPDENLEQIIRYYHENEKAKDAKKGKNLLKCLLDKSESTPDQLKKDLAEYIIENEIDMEKLNTSLRSILKL